MEEVHNSINSIELLSLEFKALKKKKVNFKLPIGFDICPNHGRSIYINIKNRVQKKKNKTPSLSLKTMYLVYLVVVICLGSLILNTSEILFFSFTVYFQLHFFSFK